MSSIQATEKSDIPKDLKSLVASSEPDKSAPSTYEGPPIGYGARVVEHTSAAGTTTVYGNVIVPRPRYVQRCVYESCEYCKGGEATPRRTNEWNGYFATPVKCQKARQDGTKRVSPRALLIQDIERVLMMMEEAA